MNDAGAMDRIESARGLRGETDRLPHREVAALAHELRDVLSFDELPDHVVRAVGQSGEIVQCGDVRMLHARREPRLAQKTIVCIGAVRDLRTDHFDHARRAEVGVLDFVDLAHAAGAEAFDYLVFAVDRLVGVAALEVGDRLAAMRARLVVAFDFSVTARTLKWHWRLPTS